MKPALGRPTIIAARPRYFGRLLLVIFAVSAFLTLLVHSFMPRTFERSPDAGVSEALAQQRAMRVSNLRYGLTLRIPATRSEAISGRLQAAFTLTDTTTPVLFDFGQPPERLLAVTIGGKRVKFEHVNGHIVIPESRLVVGENTVTFDFVSGDEPLNRHDDFLYSLFVPARASLAFPCFDQPDIKARWQLTLHVPHGWAAVSNGRESGRVRTRDDDSIIFDETEPISTYLFALAAGKFQIESATVDGRTFRMFHRETDATRLTRNRQAIFDLHAKALNWLTEYTDIPYAFGKFDFVLLPSFQFGGMEHPGAIFYNANALLLDEAATENQALARANVIAHETSHMWFGDLVTMRWFNDVWMKEVFANFYAARIVNPSFPEINHGLRFLLQHYPAAYEVDRTAGANPVRQELANLAEAGSLYGPIIYQKTPIVMRQLEMLVGPEVFQQGVRAYLQAHRFGNASWHDLVAEIDTRTPLDVAGWSRAWIEERGRPTIRTDLRIENGRIAALSLRQSDPQDRGVFWPERLSVTLGTGRRTVSIDVTLESGDTSVPKATGLPVPDWILPAGGGLGYALFELDAKSRTALIASIEHVGEPLTRGAALVTLWDAMLEGQVPPATLRDTMFRALPVETDELNLQQLLDYSTALFWRYTLPEDRPSVAARLEPLLRAGIARARTTSVRTAWFNALRSVASTSDTVAWLERIWSRAEKVPGLPLSETDEADLAFELAIRGLPNAGAILDTQLGRMQNPDRKARFAFLMPAASSDPVMRDGFFQSMRDRRNRAHEAWVLDAMRYLNHPLRAQVSARYVRPALELVLEIQRTGDIFFPKRWTDAALSGYQDARTAAEVSAFIAQLPGDYPPRLRWILQSAADPLQRAARLLEP